MKKILFLTLVMVGTILASCGGSTPKLGNDLDTLSYAFGVSQTRGLRDYLTGRLGVDTTYMDQFEKGLNDGLSAGDDAKRQAYIAGLQIGQQIANQIIPGINHELFDDDSTKCISQDKFMEGLRTGLYNKPGVISPDEAYTIFQIKMQKIKDEVMQEKYGPNKLAGEQFLAENAQKEGVKILPSGVQYKVLVEGNGPIASEKATVVCNYEGRLINDTIFDSSYKREKPFETKVTRVIKGWTDALTAMPAGSTWEIYIPQELAYGARKQGLIDPYSALVFKVELLEVKEPEAK